MGIPKGFYGAILGRSEVGPVNKPVLIKRPGQVVVSFGGALKSKFLGICTLGFLENKGPGCYAVNVAEESPGGYEEALKALRKIDDIAYVAVPGERRAEIHDIIVDDCEELGTRVAILDVPLDYSDRFKKKPAGVAGEAVQGQEVAQVQGAEAEQSEQLPELVPRVSNFSVYYYPWLTIWDYRRGYLDVPPSGHVMALYARNAARLKMLRPDVTGAIVGTKGLQRVLTKEERDALSALGIKFLSFNKEENQIGIFEAQEQAKAEAQAGGVESPRQQ